MSSNLKQESPETNRSSVLDVCVRNPITHNTWDDGRYTSYEIAINTTNQAFCLGCSVTRRRYSDFEWLRKRLNVHHPRIKPPHLPPKKYFGDRFDPSFIAFRMKGLETFLMAVLEEKMYMSDALLHLFLQSNLTNKEIDDVMDGRIPSYVIDNLWKAKGDKTKLSEFREGTKAVKEAVSVTFDLDDRISLSDDSQESFTDSGSSATEGESSSNNGDTNFPPVTMVTGEIDSLNGQTTLAKTVIHSVFDCKDSGVSSSEETFSAEKQVECKHNLQTVVNTDFCNVNSEGETGGDETAEGKEYDSVSSECAGSGTSDVRTELGQQGDKANNVLCSD